MNDIILQANSPEILKPFKQVVAKLNLIADLLEAFHDLAVKYCHWKSNEHLAASMLGTTDLDILFDEQDKTGIEAILNSFGFKKFISGREKQYKDVEDFIGVDSPSGKIVHVHAHFKLTLGERYLKGYQLNLEAEILGSRVFDIEFGIYRSAPAFELILLYFRHALKLRNRDILRYYLKDRVSYSKYILAEYHWLKLRCTNDEVESLLKSLFCHYFPIYNLVTKEFSHEVLLQLSRILHKTFREQRLYSPLKATLLRWYREIAIKASRKWTKISSKPIVSQRVHPREGLIVSIVGADGSGKSTVIGNMQATFRSKIDVYSIYMGRGNSGKISWQRKILRWFKKSYSQLQHREKEMAPGGISSNYRRPFKFELFKCMVALAVARERKKKLKLMQKAKANGMLVICDRFPQNQLIGYNDGPVLNYLLHSKNSLFRLLAKQESRTYKLAEDNPPDIVFKLIADAEVVAARKSGKASLEMLKLKIEGIRRLEFPDSCKVVTIDAGRPLNEVLVSIKRELWAAWI